MEFCKSFRKFFDTLYKSKFCNVQNHRIESTKTAYPVQFPIFFVSTKRCNKPTFHPPFYAIFPQEFKMIFSPPESLLPTILRRIPR